MREFSIIIILIYCFTLNGFSQVNNSPNENKNYSDWQSDAAVINKFYKGGTNAFFKIINRHLIYPESASTICSQAIILIDCIVLRDTIIINFHNRLGLGFEESIIDVLNQTKNNWKRIPRKGIRFKYSIAFVIEVDSSKPNDIISGSTVFTTKILRNVNCLFYRTDNLYDGCVFESNDFLLKKIEEYKVNNNLDSLNMMQEELIRRDPLRKYLDIK